MTLVKARRRQHVAGCAGKQFDLATGVQLVADGVAGLYLGTQQVEVEVGVHLTHLSWVIAPAMVAAAKKRDGIHMTQLQGLLSMGGIKGLAGLRDRFVGVEDQVDLSKTHGICGLGHGKSE